MTVSLLQGVTFGEQGEIGVSGEKPRPIACPICQAAACFMAAHPEADIYRCKCCTHAFSDPGSMPQQESYDPDYYGDTHRRWFEHPNTALFERITALIPAGASVLDVGCGRGDFLRHVHRNRPDVQLTGIDYSPNQDKNIRFLQGDAFELEIRDRFDVVVSLNVIEHVSDCVAFANRLRELTKPGGTIAIMTVNESSILYGLARFGRSWVSRWLLIVCTRAIIFTISPARRCSAAGIVRPEIIPAHPAQLARKGGGLAGTKPYGRCGTQNHGCGRVWRWLCSVERLPANCDLLGS